MFSSISSSVAELKGMSTRKFLLQLVNLGYVLGSAYTIWTFLILIWNTASPIVVVLSGSMEPSYFRGDILFLTNHDDPYHVGDIVVYQIPGDEIPIVHRVTSMQEDPNTKGEYLVVTKGDNNEVDDRSLWAHKKLGETKFFLKSRYIQGRIRACAPYIGMVTIWFTDYPLLKFGVLILAALFILTSYEREG